MIEIRPGRGAMGQSVFTTAKVTKGTRLIGEAPVILFIDGSKPFTQFQQIVSKFGDNKKAEIDKLYHSPIYFDRNNPGNVQKIAADEGALEPGTQSLEELKTTLTRFAKFMTNVIQIQTKDDKHVSAVFSTISRINHSCVPNAYCSLNAKLGKAVVHATRDLEAGEQVFINYLGPAVFNTKAQRNVFLYKDWGFNCACSACTQPETTDPDYLQAGRLTASIVELGIKCCDEELEKSERNSTALEALAKNHVLVAFLTKAELVGETLRDAYRYAALLNVVLQRYPSVIRCTRKCLETQKTAEGEDGVDKQWCLEEAENMSATYKKEMLALLEQF